MRNIKISDYHQQVLYPKWRHKLPTNNLQETQKLKWDTFTYYDLDTRTITKLFKNTNIRIVFKMTNTIWNHLKPREITVDIYNQIRVYQLQCEECSLKYVRETGCTFKVQYRKHIQAIKTNRSQNMSNIYSTQDTHMAQSTKP